MSKTSKVITSAAALTAIVGTGVATGVHAEEVTTPVASSTTVANESTAKTDLKTVEQEVNQAKQSATKTQEAVTAQESVVAEKQDVANQATVADTEATTALTQAQSDAAKASSDTIAQAKGLVDSKTEQVATAESKVSDAKEAVASANAVAESQTQKLSVAAEKVSEQKAIVSEKEQALKQAEADQSSNTKEQAQVAVDKAEANVQAKEKAVKDASAADAKQDEAIKTAENKLAKVQAQTPNQNLDTLKQNVTSTNDALNTVNAKIKDTQNQLTSAENDLKANATETVTPAKLVLPSTYDLSKPTETMAKTQEYLALQKFDIKTNTTLAEQNEMVDLSKLTDDQLKRINEYGVALINDLRKQYLMNHPDKQGTGLFESSMITEGAIKFAKDVSKEYVNNNKSIFDENATHYITGIQKAATDNGLAKGTGNIYEDLVGDASGIDDNGTIGTMAKAKELVYRMISHFVFNNTELNHASDILNSASPSQYIGLSIDTNDEGMAQLHVLQYSAHNIVDASKHSLSTAGLSSTFAEQSSDIKSQETQAKIDSLKADLQKLTTDKTSAEQKLKDAQTSLDKANDAKTAQEQAVAQAKKQLEEAKAVPKQLPNAEAQLEKAKSELNSAKKRLKAVSASAEDKAQAVDKAKVALDESKAELAKYEQELAKEKALAKEAEIKAETKRIALDEVIKTVEDAKAALTEAKNVLSRLENASENLTKAKANKALTVSALKQAKTELENAITKLNSLKADHKVAEDAYQLVLARYNSLKAILTPLAPKAPEGKLEAPIAPKTHNTVQSQKVLKELQAKADKLKAQIKKDQAELDAYNKKMEHATQEEISNVDFKEKVLLLMQRHRENQEELKALTAQIDAYKANQPQLSDTPTVPETHDSDTHNVKSETSSETKQGSVVASEKKTEMTSQHEKLVQRVIHRKPVYAAPKANLNNDKVLSRFDKNNLPQTGDRGNSLITLIGAVFISLGVWTTKKRHN